MVFVCKYCTIDKSLHTFQKQSETETNVIFYSCMSEARDKNVEQIIHHFNGTLQDHHENTLKTWVWVIDSKNFTFQWHFFTLFKELLKVYDTYKTTLLEIQIINMNKWMKFFLKMCTPLMSKDLKSKLHFIN